VEAAPSVFNFTLSVRFYEKELIKTQEIGSSVWSGDWQQCVFRRLAAVWALKLAGSACLEKI
jgi:hypothetical protein